MADSTTHIISYQADIRDVKTQLQELQRINGALTKQLGQDFANAAKVINQSVDRVRTKKIIDPATGKETVQVMAQLSTVFKDSTGKLKTFTEQVKVLDNGSLQPLNATLKNGGKVGRNFGDNIATLAKRALLTIPIWLALRSAILGVFNGISGGFRNIIAFDKALQQVKRNLSGTPDEIARSLGTLRTELTKTSLELGISTEDLAQSVKKFASLGFNLEDSLAGGIGSAKLATVLFGDASETADAFARSLNLLIDRSKGAKSAQDQMAEAFALTAELEKTNQFEIKEVNDSLKNFGGTAKSLGLSTRETLAILATLGTNLLEGARGGTLASSAFQQLIGNLSKVAGTLGVSVNPQVESTTQIFTKVIDQIDRLGKTDIVRQTEAINKLFGGLKGARPVRALIADLQRLKDNLAIAPDVAKFNKAVVDVNDSISGQSKILGNLSKEIGKAFVNGLVGTDDFLSSLKTINATLEGSIDGMKRFGQIINQAFRGGIVFQPLIEVLDAQKALEDFKGSLQSLANQGLKGGLGTKDLSKLISDLTVQVNDGKIDVSSRTLGELRKQLEKQINGDLDKNQLDIETKANVKAEISSVSFLSTKEQQDLSKLIVSDQLEQLKLQGASTSELNKQEGILNKQFGIYESEFDVLKRQLDTERALTAEKRLQNKLGSDSIKLFDIAQSEGIGVAKKIGDVLAGNTDFSSFVRQGGKALEVFKAQFEDVFKNQQAEAFFKGSITPGLNTLQGGSGIAIEEQNIRNRGLSSFNPTAELARQRAVAQLPTFRNEIQARIQLSVDVSGLSFREAVEAMKQEMAREILDPKSDISKAVEAKVEGI